MTHLGRTPLVRRHLSFDHPSKNSCPFRIHVINHILTPGILHGSDASFSSINHAHLTVVCSTSDHVPALLKLGSRIACLKLIVVIDEISPALKHALDSWADSLGIKVKGIRESRQFLAASRVIKFANKSSISGSYRKCTSSISYLRHTRPDFIHLLHICKSFAFS